jgi:hypothetical protein
MVRSIAPALLLFASATSYEAGKEYGYPAVEKDAEYPANHETYADPASWETYGNQASQDTYDYPASQDTNDYPARQDSYDYPARQDSYEYPEKSSLEYEETEESELPNSQEYESTDDEQYEDIEDQETTAPCIESCPIPCDVQQMYLVKFVHGEEVPLSTEDLEDMCRTVVEMEEDEELIYEELEALLPELEEEALAFGLNVLDGDKEKLELANEALKFAVIGEKMWEAEEEIEETADPLFTFTPAPCDTNEVELSLPEFKDAVNEKYEAATNYEPADSLLPTLTSTITNAYKPELPLTMNVAKQEITTAAANAGESAWAKKKSQTPISNRYEAPKHFIEAQRPKHFRVAVTKAPIVPTYPAYETHGVPPAEKATQYNEPAYSTRGANGAVGQRTRTYPSTKTGVPTAEEATHNEPASYTRGTDAAVGQRTRAYPSTGQRTRAYPSTKTDVPTADKATHYEPAHYTRGTNAAVGQRTRAYSSTQTDVPTADKATNYEPAYYTRGTNAPVGQRTRAYPSTKTGAAANYPSIPKRNVGAYTMPRTETNPLTSVAPNSVEDKRVAPAHHHSKYTHYAKRQYHGDY